MMLQYLNKLHTGVQTGPDGRSMILVLVHDFIKELNTIGDKIPFPFLDSNFCDNTVKALITLLGSGSEGLLIKRNFLRVLGMLGTYLISK